MRHEHALPKDYQLYDYQVGEVLGEGGFGITYLCYHQQADKHMAIKEYLPGDLAVRVGGLRVKAKSTEAQADYDWGLDRFMQEGHTLSLFDHPNLVRIYRSFKANGTAYIVMDYVEGETLSAYFKRHGKLNEAELKAVLLPILDGLEKVHQQDFLHRDIKPANIVIRHTDRQPVLIDFGAARQAIGAKSRDITKILTEGYAPIEQYSSRGKFGAWTDIYALGVVSYVALCGRNVEAAGDRMLNDELIPAAELAKGMASQEFLRAIDTALNNRPEDRPQSVGEWRGMLVNTEEDKRIAELKRQIYTRDEDGYTLLHRAARIGETKKVRKLIELGAEIEAREKGNTPLHHAAWFDQTETVLALIQAGAEIEAWSYGGNTPLHLAATKGNAETALALIQAGAEIAAQNNSGDTPLLFAAGDGHTETARALIQAGADATARHYHGDTPAQRARTGGHPDTADVIEATHQISSVTIDVYARNKSDRTPLHRAALNRDTEKVRELIELGAEIDAREEHGDTPLHIAARNGQTKIVLALIQAGAEIEAQDQDGENPLHTAAWFGETETAMALLKAGAEIKAQNKYGNTPLHCAARNGYTETALALIEAGADANARNNKGETPAQVARSKEHTATADAIEAAQKELDRQKTHTRDADGWTPLHRAARIGKTEKVLELIELGADIDAQSNGGITPLHRVASHGHTETVRALIKAGAKIEARCVGGATSLYYAAQNGQTETALALIKAGAEIEAQDNADRTPLCSAAEFGQTETALVLIQAGADVNARNNKGETPAQAARKSGRTDTAATAEAIEAAQKELDRQNKQVIQPTESSGGWWGAFVVILFILIVVMIANNN